MLMNETELQLTTLSQSETVTEVQLLMNKPELSPTLTQNESEPEVPPLVLESDRRHSALLRADIRAQGRVGVLRNLRAASRVRLSTQRGPARLRCPPRFLALK